MGVAWDSESCGGNGVVSNDWGAWGVVVAAFYHSYDIYEADQVRVMLGYLSIEVESNLQMVIEWLEA